MKKITRFLLAVFLGACAFLFASDAEEPQPSPRASKYIVGLSPYLEKEVKDDVFRRIARLMLEEMPLNSTLSLYDAYNVRTIAEVKIPNLAPFTSGKTRANQFKEQILKLKEFLATEHARPTGGRVPPPGGSHETEASTGPSGDRAIRFPQFLDFVGEHHATETEPLVVIVLGSPLYIDSKEPGFSMLNGYFPSDGHLLAGREQSVYGLKDRNGLLKNVQVYFGFFGDPWISELHQEKISRFWTLYLKEQAAHLSTFTSDLPTVFKSAVGAQMLAQRRPDPTLERSQTKLEMLRITRDVGVADWITRALPPNHQQPPPSKTVGPMKIGIRWEGDLDLDLYASATADSETLFFEHTRAPEGYYFKDHRSSPEREYEFIEFETPVDVYQVKSSINFYEGRAPDGASGEIRIEFEGRIYSERFTLAAHRGNKGRSGRSQSDFWARIDVPAILRLREAEQALNATR